MLAGLVDWLDERMGLGGWYRKKKAMIIPAHVNFFYCFGGLSLVVIIMLVVSGFLMLFFFVPEPSQALVSMDKLSNDVPLGWLIRNLHRWSATILLATVFSHMVSVFYHKAYRRPRELNWMTGVLMFVIVFLMTLTGIFLPWDWKAYWSMTIWLDYVATWPLVGEAMVNIILDTFTINRNFITHIWILPVVLAVLLVFHFKMVKKHGISEPL